MPSSSIFFSRFRAVSSCTIASSLLTHCVPSLKRTLLIYATDVKNSDLWKLLEEKIQNHEIHWMWVKGHNENIFNEKADMLAKKAIES